MAKAVCIVSVNDDNSNYFHEENLRKVLAVEELKNCKIVPISITGAMRTGKSFMLNYFLRYLRAQYISHDVSNWLGDKDEPLKGFEWRSDVNRVTCGIMMWSEVFLHDSQKHGKLAIVLMDTQGLFDNQASPKDNSTIFGLSSMLVSLQIYNVMNNLNENDLKLMHLFAEYGRAVFESMNSKPFQNLTILVRDWNQHSGLDFGSDGGQELVEKRMKGDPQMDTIRNDIYANFDSVTGFLMRHPGDMSLDKKDFDGRIGDLHAIFIKTLKTFVELVLSPENLTPKRMNGENVTVTEYVTNFRYFAEVFRESELPATENFVGSLAINNAATAMRAGVNQYRDAMSKPQEDIESLYDLDNFHGQTISKVLDQFDEKTRFGKIYAGIYREQMQQLIGEFYDEVKKKTAEVLAEKKAIKPFEFPVSVMEPLLYSFLSLSILIEGMFFPVAAIVSTFQMGAWAVKIAAEMAKHFAKYGKKNPESDDRCFNVEEIEADLKAIGLSETELDKK